MVIKEEEKHVTGYSWYLHTKRQETAILSFSMYQGPDSPAVSTALQKDTRALLFLVCESSHREGRPVSPSSFATSFISRAACLSDQQKGG